VTRIWPDPRYYEEKSLKMLALTDEQLQTIVTEAATLPVDKRTIFLERVAAVLELRRCAIESAISEAIAGLRHLGSQ
jgi:hypothetical protein